MFCEFMAKSRLRWEQFLSWPCYDTLLEIWFINVRFFFFALRTQFVSILMKRFIKCATCTPSAQLKKKKKKGKTLASNGNEKVREELKKQSMCVANLFESRIFYLKKNAKTHQWRFLWCFFLSHTSITVYVCVSNNFYKYIGYITRFTTKQD